MSRGGNYLDAHRLLDRYPVTRRKGAVQLVFTSPPFALNRKKKYGNLQGQEYVDWLASFAPMLSEYLTPTGSIVIELGNAWEPGSPTMSTLSLEALLAFKRMAGLHLCQEFVCFNPARLPSPAQWVTVKRIRVKDAFTRVWWLSPTARPKADNRKVLTEYSDSMKKLLERGTYNDGVRPSLNCWLPVFSNHPRDNTGPATGTRRQRQDRLIRGAESQHEWLTDAEFDRLRGVRAAERDSARREDPEAEKRRTT